MLTIPYTEKPQFNFDDVVNYYHQQAIIKGMAYTSFSFCDDVPCWYYLIQSINDNSWFQAWLIEEELIMYHKNNPTNGSIHYDFFRR